MGKQYPSSTTWENKVVEILNISGARSIFLLFFDCHDTESKFQKIEISAAQKMPTQGKQQ